MRNALFEICWFCEIRIRFCDITSKVIFCPNKKCVLYYFFYPIITGKSAINANLSLSFKNSLLKCFSISIFWHNVWENLTTPSSIATRGQSFQFNSIQEQLNIRKWKKHKTPTIPSQPSVLQGSNLTVYTHISAVAFSQIVGEVVLYLADELLGVLGVESEDLAEALEADILQVTIGQGFDISVGLDHLLLGQVVWTNQISFTWEGAPT